VKEVNVARDSNEILVKTARSRDDNPVWREEKIGAGRVEL
jgi:hypothetical protein